jgi:hypothetical protein
VLSGLKVLGEDLSSFLKVLSVEGDIFGSFRKEDLECCPVDLFFRRGQADKGDYVSREDCLYG